MDQTQHQAQSQEESQEQSQEQNLTQIQDHNQDQILDHSQEQSHGQNQDENHGLAQSKHITSTKRPNSQQGGRSQRKMKKSKRERNITEGSSEEVLRADVEDLIASLTGGADATAAAAAAAATAVAATSATADHVLAALVETGTEHLIRIHELSSTGDGLGTIVESSSSSSSSSFPHSDSLSGPPLPTSDDTSGDNNSAYPPVVSSPPPPPRPRIYVVPFSLPGDTVHARVYAHPRGEAHSLADFLSVVTPSPLRDDSRPQCRYFATCSGCQFQMLDYAEQLRVKRRVVERAFARFSGLDPSLVPVIRDTIGSPLQYGYRTKLTPHFDVPPGHSQGRRRKNASGPPPSFNSCPDVGFMQKGRRKVMDIEDCPIGTEAVRRGMARERARMRVEYARFSRGATILLRESTERFPKRGPDATRMVSPPPMPAPAPAPVPDTIRVETDDYVDLKTCITDNNAISTEYVDSFVFTNPAGSFFQNNNSILPSFTDYIRKHILPPDFSSNSSSSSSSSSSSIEHLIDAYSGSGLFTITLSSLFASSIGVDVSPGSIASAANNAAANGISADRAHFLAADARELFRDVADRDPDRTTVVLDPPRKGCDADFLAQLLRFAPRRVVYVSCNVHTQARDVGILVRGGGGGKYDEGRTRYEIESLCGFDFFPQTAHVEGVAVLKRVDLNSQGPVGQDQASQSAQAAQASIA